MSRFFLFLFISVSAYTQVVQTINFDRFSHYDPDDWITYAFANNISSIDMDYDNVYFATRGGGILRYSMFDNKWLYPFTTSTGLRSNYVYKIAYDYQKGLLYALTDAGIDEYNPGFRFWQPSGLSDMPGQQLPPGRVLGSSELDPYSRPSNSKLPTLFPEGNYTLTLDGEIIDPDNYQFKLTDRVVDLKRRLWLGTNGTGIGLADLTMQSLEFIFPSIPAINPRAVYIDNDQTWIAGRPFKRRQSGISLWDMGTGKWDYFKEGIVSGITTENVNVISGDEQDVLFGSRQGLFGYNLEKNKWHSYRIKPPLKDNNIFDIVYREGIFYIATDNGVFTFSNKDIGSIQHKELLHTNVYKLALADSLLFMATDRGIYRYNILKDQISLVPFKTAIANNFVTAVAVNKDTLWFGGETGIGYHKLNTDVYVSFPDLVHSFHPTIYQIVFTDFYTWFATDAGLLKYDLDRDYWYLYTTQDGLADNRVYHIDVQGDYLWLATEGGLTVFHWYSDSRYE